MRFTKIFAIVIAIAALIFIIIMYKPHKQVFTLSIPERKVFKLESYTAWKNCISHRMNYSLGNPEQNWQWIAQATTECEKGYVESLKIQDFPNSDEVKHHILPLADRPEPSIIITLGVGYDIGAEEKLRQTMGRRPVQFYGADPMVEMNEALFSRLGSFFPFAVGANPGVSVANVMENGRYYDKLVVHVDMVYFLTNLVRKTFIDDLWLDAEGAEYDLFGFFLKRSLFDENGITFCQINMEMHSPTPLQKKQIHDFLFNVLEDERYAFFLPVQGDHLRLFFVNFEDAGCVEKYIGQNATKVN